MTVSFTCRQCSDGLFCHSLKTGLVQRQWWYAKIQDPTIYHIWLYSMHACIGLFLSYFSLARGDVTVSQRMIYISYQSNSWQQINLRALTVQMRTLFPGACSVLVVKLRKRQHIFGERLRICSCFISPTLVWPLTNTRVITRTAPFCSFRCRMSIKICISCRLWLNMTWKLWKNLFSGTNTS